MGWGPTDEVEETSKGLSPEHCLKLRSVVSPGANPLSFHLENDGQEQRDILHAQLYVWSRRRSRVILTDVLEAAPELQASKTPLQATATATATATVPTLDPLKGRIILVPHHSPPWQRHLPSALQILLPWRWIATWTGLPQTSSTTTTTTQEKTRGGFRSKDHQARIPFVSAIGTRMPVVPILEAFRMEAR